MATASPADASDTGTDTEYRIDADADPEDAPALDSRDVRAVTQGFELETIADGLYEVQTMAGGTYMVDPDSPACTCPDFQHRHDTLGDAGCKHIRYVRFATGARPISDIVAGANKQRAEIRDRIDALEHELELLRATDARFVDVIEGAIETTQAETGGER